MVCHHTAGLAYSLAFIVSAGGNTIIYACLATTKSVRVAKVSELMASGKAGLPLVPLIVKPS